MGGFEFAALGGLFGITSAIALVGTVFAAWMAWRIVEKAGLPGWVGLGAVLITLTGIGSIVPLILLWVFAFMRWPRDEGRAAVTYAPGQPQPNASPNAQIAAPRPALPPASAARGWQLSGGGYTLSFSGTSSAWMVTGGPVERPGDLSLPDASVGRPHARLLVAGERIGLEDLGTPGGTAIDGARLLPEHGPRDITAARTLRFGAVDMVLSRS
jgi:hypothetical protein